jgi:hypothetical protein
LLKRGIEFEDPCDIFEARFIVGAKRVCIALAVIALGISGHDLLSSRPLGSTVAFARGNENAQVARKPAAEIAMTASATVAIPDDRKPVIIPTAAKNIAAKPKTSPVAANHAAVKPKTSPVAELAEARHLNALEIAMAFEPARAKATASDLTLPVPVKAEAKPEEQPMQVASIAPQSLPRDIRAAAVCAARAQPRR